MLLFNWQKVMSVKGKITILSCLIYLVVFFLLMIFDNNVIKTTVMSFRCIVFDFMLFLIVTWFIEKGYLKENRIIGAISKYSFGIYVFHHWIAWDLFHLDIVIESFKSNYILYALLYTVSIFLMSVVLTKYSLNTKIGKFLLS